MVTNPFAKRKEILGWDGKEPQTNHILSGVGDVALTPITPSPHRPPVVPTLQRGVVDPETENPTRIFIPYHSGEFASRGTLFERVRGNEG